jgi:hypothetical protein
MVFMNGNAKNGGKLPFCFGAMARLPALGCLFGRSVDNFPMKKARENDRGLS